MGASVDGGRGGGTPDGAEGRRRGGRGQPGARGDRERVPAWAGRRGGGRRCREVVEKDRMGASVDGGRRDVLLDGAEYRRRESRGQPVGRDGRARVVGGARRERRAGSHVGFGVW